MVHFRFKWSWVARSPDSPVLVVVVVVVLVVVARGRPVAGTCCGAGVYHSPPFTEKHLIIILSPSSSYKNMSLIF